MNRISTVALAAALSLSMTGMALAQVSAGTVTDAAGQAGTSTTVQAGDTTAGATTNATGAVTGAASGSADTNNDGTVSAEEQAAAGANAAAGTNVNATTPAGNVSAGANAGTDANAAAGGNATGGTQTGGGNGAGNSSGGGIVSADTNGDGTVSPAERQAAATAAGMSAEMACDDNGPTGAIESSSAIDPNAIAAVTSVVVITLTGCDDEDFDTSTATTVQSTIAANSALQAEVAAQAGPAADIVGATLSGTTLTVYVRS